MIEDIEKKIDVKIVYALLSGKVTNAINRTLSKKLKEANIDVSPAQVSILYSLWHQDGVTQKVLSDYTSKDKPSITRLLDNMDKVGLIKRQQDKSDRRVNRIFLTPKANSIKECVREATNNALQEGFKGISAEEMNIVQQMMKIIFNNLSSNLSTEGNED